MLNMDAVILDVGGVLLVPHAETVSTALGMALDPETAERAHYVGVRALDHAPLDRADEFRAYREAYAGALGIPDDQRAEANERINVLWSGPTIDLWRQPVRDSVDGLRQLAQQGIKLGIVSNADGTIEEQLKRGEICQVGEGLGVPVLAIIDSHVVGVWKPAAEIFRHALDPIGVEPERAIYVGDTIRYDVAGARAAGLRPIHFDPYELCPHRDDHAHARKLPEVLDA
jgi:putative hydrolase of the HAD superfamily